MVIYYHKSLNGDGEQFHECQQTNNHISLKPFNIKKTLAYHSG